MSLRQKVQSSKKLLEPPMETVFYYESVSEVGNNFFYFTPSKFKIQVPVQGSSKAISFSSHLFVLCISLAIFVHHRTQYYYHHHIIFVHHLAFKLYH